jgi:hypothetical protein
MNVVSAGSAKVPHKCTGQQDVPRGTVSWPKNIEKETSVRGCDQRASSCTYLYVVISGSFHFMFCLSYSTLAFLCGHRDARAPCKAAHKPFNLE